MQIRMVFLIEENATPLPRTNDNMISECILFKKINKIYYIYMLIKNGITHDISYENIVIHFTILCEFLVKNNIT
jgi:hypothetical protein